MARFDVYRDRDGQGHLLDVQANIMSLLNTRIVVPLLRPAGAPIAAKGLNPEFGIGDARMEMVTQFHAAVPVSALKEPVATLDQHHTLIVDAIDLLLQGF